ncbi:hypothetical protein BN961_02554 [Afipia felis]|uniref:Uncharacterized protein n=1 Tax=Afipia felis TaxID=1035 RepID=A0A090N7U1_AFIFE|nr:hypothetical protein BN961_02554 [Afipia felis]
MPNAYLDVSTLTSRGQPKPMMQRRMNEKGIVNADIGIASC